MRFHKTFHFLIFLVLGMGIVQTALALEGNPRDGENKTANCQGCHGIPGFRTAYPSVYTVPKLGGQSVMYLANALKAYRSGDRTHAGMRAIASSLSDQDIADLAAYYSENKDAIVSNQEGEK